MHLHGNNYERIAAMKKELPTVEYLRKTIRYDATTGKMYWLKRTNEHYPPKTANIERSIEYWNNNYAGKETATYKDGRGYFKCRVNKIAYGAHRVAWALYHGKWPDKQIDHINGNPLDNRIKNMRVVSVSENGKNKKRPSTNTSGIIGVYWNKASSKWVAQIGVNRKTIFLGSYDNITDAANARQTAEKKYNFHPNHGR